MTWQLLTAAAIGGLAGAATRDILRAIARSDWMFGVILRSDLRALSRAKRRKSRRTD